MRTGYHLAPRRGWLNDPNGMLWRDGRWHVFFQHNPAVARHGDIAWGHVSSDDLVTWREHPVAFGPTAGGADAYGCWSGVALDLGDRVATFYTAAEVTPADTTVCVRYSSDAELDTWSGPVVVARQAQVPDEVGLVEMRDPFLFEAGGRRWAVIGATRDVADERHPAILLWSADDLESWEYVGVWLDDTDPVMGDLVTGQMWECPQLVDVDGTAALLLSVWLEGDVVVVVQAVGELVVPEGEVPTFQPRSGGRFDAGDACYAPQVALDEDGPWALGWVREDGLADGVDDPEAQAGCLTLVRRPVLTGGRLTWVADPRAEALVGDVVPVGEPLPVACRVDLPSGGVVSQGDRRLELPPGSVAWLDGSVLEAYPPGDVPVTHRWTDAGGWSVTGDGAAVRRVAHP